MPRQKLSIDQKIEKAKEDIEKTKIGFDKAKAKYDKAVKTLSDLEKKRDSAKKDELLEALMKSTKSSDEILSFLSSDEQE